MRIGIFSDVYRPQINGVVYVIDILRSNLEALGHEVFIFAPRPRGYQEADPHIIRFNSVGGLFFDDYLTSVFFPPKQMRCIKRMDLDLIFVLSPSQVGILGAGAARRYKIPLVHQYSTDLMEYILRYPGVVPGVVALTGIAYVSLRPDFKNSAEILRETWLKRRPKDKSKLKISQKMVKSTVAVFNNCCDAVVALSPKIECQLLDWGTKVRIEQIPTGVDAIESKPEQSAAWRRRWKIKPKEKIVLYVGRLGAEKNLDLLLDSFDIFSRQYAGWKLVLVGDFDYRPNLEAHAAELDSSERIIFTGAEPREKLGAIYAAADIFAFPSITDTQGLVLHEAAHAGLPLVMVDRETSPLLIDGETGFFAEENSPLAFSQALARVADLPSGDYKKMSRRVQIQASNYSERAQTLRLLSLFEDLTGDYYSPSKTTIIQKITSKFKNWRKS